jgi:transposase-like protein
MTAPDEKAAIEWPKAVYLAAFRCEVCRRTFVVLRKEDFFGKEDCEHCGSCSSSHEFIETRTYKP